MAIDTQKMEEWLTLLNSESTILSTESTHLEQVKASLDKKDGALTVREDTLSKIIKDLLVLSGKKEN